MSAAHDPDQAQALAAQVRQQLVAQAGQLFDPMLNLLQERLAALMDEAVSSRDMQLRRDAWMLFQQCRSKWRDGTLQAWHKGLDPAPQARNAPVVLDGSFELLGTEVLENKIIASRMVLNLMESASQEVNDLRKRLKFLNNNQDLDSRDLVHPDVLLQLLVEQWGRNGLSADAWQLVGDTVQKYLTAQLPRIYAQCNADLIAKGVLPVIEFGAVQHTPEPPGPSGQRGARPEPPALDAAAGLNMAAAALPPMPAGLEPMFGAPARAGAETAASPATLRRQWQSTAQSMIEQIGRLLGVAPRRAAPAGLAAPAGPAGPGPLPAVEPVYAAGLDLAAGAPAPAVAVYAAPSPALLAALARQPLVYDAAQAPELASPVAAPLVLQRVAGQLRQQSTELKEQARTDSEKAVIELVTLMFQAILQEDRIASRIRVWFARLQMPVLRVALAEPDFFSRNDHPARQLIDHMGSCVMGFDASGIENSALEAEIKRIVQVVEQYPETGERVYRNVYAEFLTFLKQHLVEQPARQKVMGVAEQVEQKETLTIQYTIELRQQIEGLPVRAEIRDFLFKVWAEVMALATLRQGARHEETLRLKKTASDLVWAASAKPDRADRARMIASLPDLLLRLRAGMGLLGMERDLQESHIKIISQIVADAFMSKAQSIDEAQIQALAERLENLDDYMGDGDTEELALDAQSIEDLLGIESAELEVVQQGGAKADADTLALARELVLGSWFRLDYRGQLAQVQYVWRSPLGHLHLFASQLGRSYLIQTSRVAAYLQAGLLQSHEDAPLTLRATRDALGRLQAEPDRLLH